MHEYLTFNSFCSCSLKPDNAAAEANFLHCNESVVWGRKKANIFQDWHTDFMNVQQCAIGMLHLFSLIYTGTQCNALILLWIEYGL